MGIDIINALYYFYNMNYYYAKNTTKDSVGNRVDYIPLNSVESFSQIGDSMVVINMKAGNQFQIYKKFSTFEFREKPVEFEEITKLLYQIRLDIDAHKQND